MKKLFALLIIGFISIQLPSFAFQRPFRQGIIFNNVPFSPETAGNYTRSFNRGERIYWLFMSKKPIKAQYIGIQVVSASHKGNWATITGVAYSHDYKINKDSPHYYTDYFVIHTPGHYYMQIFDKNKLIHPLTVADFFVR